MRFSDASVRESSLGFAIHRINAPLRCEVTSDQTTETVKPYPTNQGTYAMASISTAAPSGSALAA